MSTVMQTPAMRSLLCVLCTAVAAVSGAGTVHAQSSARPATGTGSGLADMGALLGTTSRAPGMPANLALEDRVAQMFKDSGFTNGAIKFTAPVFTPGETYITMPSGERIAVEAMHPTLMRPGNFAETNFTAGLVYLGEGRYSDLERVKGIDLTGTIALMEFSCGDRWLHLLRFGFKGFVFIGGESYMYSDSFGKLYNTEVAVPRFFVSAAAGGKLRDAARAEPAASLRINAEPSRWTKAVLRDLWVLIPGADPELGKDVVVFTAPLDANSIVPGRATGAQSGANLHLLLRLLDDFRAAPPARSVILAAVNGHTQKFLGERMLAWHLLASRASVEAPRDTVALDLRIAQLYSDNYRLLQLKPVTIDHGLVNPVMEMLWSLDRKQQAQREKEKKAIAVERPESAAGTNATPNAVHAESEADEVLDLSAFVENDYREAIAAAVKRMEDKESSLLVKISSAEDTKTLLREEKDCVAALNKLTFDELKNLAGRLKPTFDDEKLLESWRTKMDASARVYLPVKEKLQGEALRNLNRLKLAQMETAGDKVLPAAERKRRLDDLSARKPDLAKVLMLFNKVDIGIGRSRTSYRQVATNEVQRAMLAGYRDRLVEKYSSWSEAWRRGLDMSTANDVIREAVGQRRVALVVSLDLNWQTDQVGFSSIDSQVANKWQLNFGQLSTAIARTQLENGQTNDSVFVDTMTSAGSRPEEYYFSESVSPAPCFHQAEGTPAFVMRSVFAGRGLVFSPEDTVARLDLARVARTQDWVRKYFNALLNHPETTSSKVLVPLETAGGIRLWSSVLHTYKPDEFSARTSPDLEVPICLVTLYPRDWAPPLLVSGDVINCYTHISDDSGMAIAYALTDSAGAGGVALVPTAYQMDGDFTAVKHVIDKGRVQASRQIISTMSRGDSTKVLPMFPCRELPIYDRTDPTLVSAAPITVHGIWPMSGVMKSEPQKFGTHGVMTRQTWIMSHRSVGPVAAYLWDKGKGFRIEPLIVLTDTKRCATRSSEENPEGIGYGTTEELGHDFFAAVAGDMDILNRSRALKMKGVANELVEEFLASGRLAVGEMSAMKAARDHTGFMRAVYKALGNETKVYEQMRMINGDMLKAIVVYMALMIPFCFFIQKLLFGFTRIEHELMAFCALFVGTYVGFRFIHPAFAIAMNPEAIFIAFVLGAIGIFITLILHGRFEGEMQLIFRSYTGMEADVGYSTVGQTAMMIGVNNMKRRRIRTTLTTATIVLVTFTMLAFSSVSKKMKPTILNKADFSPYTGFLCHWPGGRPMDEETAMTIENMFAGWGDVIIRRVMQPQPPAMSWRLENSLAGIAADIEGIMGLPLEDRDLLGVMPLVQGRYFSSASAREIILPASAGDALKIKPDQVGNIKLRILGEELTLVGLVEDERYRIMRDLNPNLPLVPLKILVGQPGGAKQSVNDAGEELSGAQTIDTSALAIIPVGTAQKMGAMPFSVSVKLADKEIKADPASLWKNITLLLTVTQAKFYAGSREPFKIGEEAKQELREGIYYIGSGYRTSIGGLQRLLIPLIIAGSIILNTMLGTVYERKSEIAVYNAVGLNPTHIFMFFLAEAFVYSVIGSVGGYLIGQILAMVLKAMNLVQGINVNFSSLMVVYAILFTIALVLLSTIYPGIVATRTAVPSGKRKWSLPPNDGQRMNVVFPFIYQPNLAAGVMFYIYEYFQAFTEKSMGDQIAGLEETAIQIDEKGRETYSMRYSVALSPFDLGITQEVLFNIRYDDVVGSCRVSMVVTRVSGQDSDWVTTNRPFLEKLRKLLIRWRNMDGTRHNWYVEQGRVLFKPKA